MMNTFKGKYNYVPDYKGAYYSAGSNSITMGDGYTDILALAHELGHATGTYQNGVALESDDNLLPSEKFALISLDGLDARVDVGRFCVINPRSAARVAKLLELVALDDKVV